MKLRYHPPGQNIGSGGFALVLVLSITALVVLTVMALVGLSLQQTRLARAEKDLEVARANARLAVDLAIDQLQRRLGPDQRVSAPAALLRPDGSTVGERDAWSGVWLASSTTPNDFTPGRPAHFQGWLVTGASPLPVEAATLPGSEAVVEMESTGPDQRTVAPLAETTGGRLAWWSSDESTKASVDLPERERASDGARIQLARLPERFGPQIHESLGDFPIENEKTRRVVNPGQIGLAAGTNPAGLSAHFTTGTRAVLSDTRLGGLKKDLSTLFELPVGSIPSEFGTWTGAGAFSDPKVYLYGDPGQALGARWNHLHAYHNLHLDVRRVGGLPVIQPRAGLIDWHLADRYQDFGDSAGGFRFPRVAKIIYVFSYTSVLQPDGRYRMDLGTDIYVTLWNPFDTGLLFPAGTTFFCKFSKGLPFHFQWYKNGAASGSKVHLGQIADGSQLFVQSTFSNPGQGSAFHMRPGESLVFSMRGPKQPTGTFGSQPVFHPGVYYTSGLADDNVLGPAGNLTGAAGDRVGVELSPADSVSAYTIGGQPTSQYVDFWIYDTNRGWPYYEHRGELIAKDSTPFTRTMPTLRRESLTSVTFAEVVNRRQPFAAFVMETRTAKDSRDPVPVFLHTGNARLSSRLESDPSHLGYERLEYKLETLGGWDSDILQVSVPGDGLGANHGFIGSGRIPATGRTHVVSHSIPAVAPSSIAAFRHAGTGDGAATLRATHWGFNSTPNPNFTDQAIGNSYAHPLVPPEKNREGRFLDHSHLANELLWDSWFLSTISTQSAAMYGTQRAPVDVWRRFARGLEPLPNPRFVYRRGNRTDAQVEAALFRGSSPLSTAHRNAAAFLMLDGPFNVHSTSVEAWTAFLASRRKREIEILGSGTARWVTGRGTVFSRTERVLAGAVDGGGTMDTHYSGYRDLGDAELRVLAGEITREVRKRGPFRNVAEFVNRRLSSDKEFSSSGALQSAMDRSGLNSAVAAGGGAGLVRPAGADTRNPDAAVMNTAAGAPGWLMQGDLLEAIGPFIVARGDTFRIRGYGEASVPQGNGRAVRARAWCEVVVQRIPEFVDPAEVQITWPSRRTINRQFGRRFEILSFRWLPDPGA